MNPKLSPEALAHHSVVALHDLIAAVFTGAASAQSAYAQLLQHFDPEFNMVTISGAKVNLAAVTQLFHSGLGKRPDLVISISHVTTLSVAEDQVWVQYQETHTLGEVETRRVAVAQVQVSADGQWRWRYLHETPVLA
ncbi:nuclear transport factor 2 family protein [Neisseriaceae bacterium CLB008]